MHADELRLAIDRVVDTLTASGILTAIRDYRIAKGDQRPVAAARLGHAGAMLMEGMGEVSAHEKTALQLLHLSSLRETNYWQDLLSPNKPEKARAAELVQLYSRVLFASNHLPNFAALLGRVTSAPAGGGPQTAKAPQAAELRAGESRVTIQLSDAGEKASDPDRIARSIDGIDMLYSASASLARRPAMDLRLDYIIGNDDRTITFTGESDSLSAMSAVIDSIPEALAELNDDQEIDLDELVQSLPIFDQLTTLAGHGAFSENDLRDIRETMHQGALLTLESGVVLPEPPKKAMHPKSQNAKNGASARSVNSASIHQQSRVNAPNQQLGSVTSAPERDEHYERYLKERAAMQNGSGANGAIRPAPDDPFPMLGNAVDVDASGAARSVDVDKQAAVEELLKTLNRQRDG